MSTGVGRAQMTSLQCDVLDCLELAAVMHMTLTHRQIITRVKSLQSLTNATSAAPGAIVAAVLALETAGLIERAGVVEELPGKPDVWRVTRTVAR